MAMNPPSIRNSYRRRDFGNPVIQAFLLLIILVLFSWFILKPKIAQTVQRRADLKVAKAQLAKLEEDQRQLNELINELRSSPDEIKLIDEALPLSGRVSKAYVLLDSLVRSSGMTVALLSSDDTAEIVSAGDKDEMNNPYQPGRQLHTITLTASVTGNMEQFRNLLQLIETNGRVLDVETVNILGGEADTKFRMTVKAYAYENEETIEDTL